MHVDFSDRGTMRGVGTADMLVVVRVQTALVDVEILTSNVELVSFIIREVHARSIDHIVFLGLS